MRFGFLLLAAVVLIAQDDPPPILTAADVQTVVQQAAAAVNIPMVVAVTDRQGKHPGSIPQARRFADGHCELRHSGRFK